MKEVVIAGYLRTAQSRSRPRDWFCKMRADELLAKLLPAVIEKTGIEANEQGGRYGCANACVGGGQGVAIIIEKEEYSW